MKITAQDSWLAPKRTAVLQLKISYYRSYFEPS